MKKLLLSIITLCALTQLQGTFISYCFLTKDGKEVLVAGLSHSQQLKEISESDAKKLFATIPFCHEKINCFYEAPDEISIQEKSAVKQSIVLQDVMVTRIEEFKQTAGYQNSLFRFHNFEPRTELCSDNIVDFLEQQLEMVLTDPDDNSNPYDSLRKYKKELRKYDLQTIKHYFDALDNTWEPTIAKWAKQLGEDHPLYNYFIQQQQEFNKSIKQVKNELRSFDQNTKIIVAIVSLLQKEKSKEKVLSRFRELQTLFLKKIDFKYIELGFFVKILKDQEKNPKTMIIAGHAHTQQLTSMLLKSGYSVKTQASVFQNGYIRTTPQFRGVFFNRLLNFVVSKEDRCSEEEIQEMIRNASDEATNSSARHRAPKELTHKKVSTCNTCRKEKTEHQKLQQCSRCKAVSYCSRACQKKDWKQHKTKCKQLAGQE